MAVIETWLRQDLKGLVTVRSLQGQVFSLDNGGNLIGVKVTKDGQPVTLTGTVTGYCILSDGQTVTVTGSGKSGIQNGNEAYIVLPQLVYSVPGQISIVIKLTSGSVTTTLAACTGYVYRSRTSNEVVPPGTPIPDLATLEEAISRANAATNSANTAASSANNAATAAENVNVAMSKSGKVITITATNRSGTSTSHTVTEPTLTVERANNVVTVTATDADGQTSIEFDAVDADEVAELQEAVSTKAEEDGYYEELAAGTADQLVSTEAVTDTTPYLYRKSGGSVDIGNRATLDKIVGGTVAWNQLFPFDEDVYEANGVKFTIENGRVACSGTFNVSSTFSIFPARVYNQLKLIKDHKYFLYISGSWNFEMFYIMYSGSIQRINLESKTPKIFNANSATITDSEFVIVAPQGTEATGTFYSYMCDLTTMFGPTIADYIYNLEQANAGDGVAWFRKLFPKDYYSYNPGELISVKPSSHDMVGFNQWDEEWENGAYNYSTGEKTANANRIRNKNVLRVFPSTAYYFKAPNNGVALFYDSSMTYVGSSLDIVANAIFTTPANAAYMNFVMPTAYGATYKNDICINLSWSGSRNGEYEPYEKHSYPLADVELRGPLAIDADGKLVYSGDEYTPDGLVTRKYKLANLGTATWSYNSTDGIFYSGDISNFVKDVRLAEKANAICPKYETVAGMGYNGGKDKSISIGYMYRAKDINIKDSAYTDANTFKASLANVWLLYELATPTTEEVDPYTSIQVVDDWGTEEFVDTREVAIPVGHSTSYMANLRDKLQHLPSLADKDGEYIVKQTGTKMELSKLSSSGLAQSIYVETESTPVVSFADGADGQAMKAVNVAIEPVQDLHGYDSPWPTGGGANLVPLTVDAIKAANGGTDTWNGNSKTINGVTYTILTDEAGNVTGINANGTATASSKFNLGTIHAVSGTTYGIKKFSADDGGSFFGNINPRFSSATDVNIYDNTTMTADSDKNVAVSYYTMAGGVANNRLITPFIAVTSTAPTAFAPYSNICPISGWTGAKVRRSGGNLWDEETVPMIINSSGEFVPSSNAFCSKNPIPVTPGQKLYIMNGSNTYIYMKFYDGDLKYINIPINVRNEEITIPNESNIAYMHFSVGSEYGSVYKHDIAINYPSTNTEYNSTDTYSITFPADPGTVYGGTLDVVSGKLVVDMAKVDLKQVDFVAMDRPANVGGGKCFLGSVITPLAIYPISEGRQKYSSGQVGDAYYASGNRCNAYQTNNRTYFRCGFADSNYLTTIEAFNDWKQQQSAFEIAYVLASPIEYTLTPQEIKTLLGMNNLWADAGNTAVTYPADTKLYIDKKIAELQALILENNG